MELVDKLLSVPQRENAGSRTSNRYTYQQVWAFNHILSLLKEQKEFILFMELHDDVIVVNGQDSQKIDFYQIKTNNKPDRYITTSFIKKDGKKYPDKMSIIQKLIDNYEKFPHETNSIHLVSNKNFDFDKLNDKSESTEFLQISLSQINDTEFNKIAEDMCKVCHLKNNCNKQCKTLIFFDVSTLDLVNYQDTVLAKFLNYIEEIDINSNIKSVKAFYNTILGEINRINNHEYKSSTVSELLQQKSISRSWFINLIDKLLKETDNDKWKDIQSYLLAEGISTILVNKIGIGWKKLQIDLMNIDNLELQNLKNDISKIISENEYDNLKLYLENIYSEISDRIYLEIYSKEYIYAIIVKELYS